MRVYYIGSGLQGCYLVRCLLPLQENGWDGDQTSLNPEAKTPENKVWACQNSDILTFHRPEDAGKLEAARRFKLLGKKIVFDNDDTYKDAGGYRLNEFMDKERLDRGLKTLNESVDAFIKEADLVTCSTEYLAKEYRELNPNVVVLPNCVDPFLYDEPLKNDTDTIRIGIVGSIGVTADMLIAEKIIRHFEGRKDIRFVLFSLPPQHHDKITRELYSDEYKFLETADLEWHPFVPMEQYYSKLNELRLDMAIIPRADNYFNRCKSNLKFLEMSMFEIPVIAQGFEDGMSPYQVDKDDEKHMQIILNNDDWIPAIEALAKDKNKREEMGKKAREYVTEKYDIKNNAHKWEDAYKTIWNVK